MYVSGLFISYGCYRMPDRLKKSAAALLCKSNARPGEKAMGSLPGIATLADVAAIEKTPYHERVTQPSTYHQIAQAALAGPGEPAISFIAAGNDFARPVQINYGQLLGRINQSANLFHALGVGPRDTVSYLLPNLPQTVFTLWGAEAAGIANPINPLLEPKAIADICRAAGTKVLVALGEMPGVDIWQKAMAVRGELPGLKAVVKVMGPAEPERGIFAFDEEVAKQPGDRLVFQRSFSQEQTASIYHTGGTTGRPKLARRSHLNEMLMAWVLAHAMAMSRGETMMLGLPLFHCNGTIVTGLAPFSTGAQVVMLTPAGFRDQAMMANFYKIVEHYRPSSFSCVPTVLSVLLDLPLGGADISSLKYVLCGAAPLSVELFNRFEEKTGMKILEGYGLTEAAVASAANPRDGRRKVGSVGLRLPYHDVRTVVLGAEGRFLRQAHTNEIGAVAIKGPCVFQGYVEPEHNQGVWLDDGWFNTGDLGRLDQEGYLWLTGREKDLIIRGGHNIDPGMIEEAMYRHPQVKAAAAVGRPDKHAGEVPVVYVSLAADADLTPGQLMEHAAGQIAERAAVPKEVIVLDALPLTAVGKVFKPALRLDAMARVCRDELAGLDGLLSDWQVQVSEDPTHGAKAVITAKASPGVSQQQAAEAIKELLARYTFRYEVAVSPSKQAPEEDEA